SSDLTGTTKWGFRARTPTARPHPHLRSATYRRRDRRSDARTDRGPVDPLLAHGLPPCRSLDMMAEINSSTGYAPPLSVRCWAAVERPVLVGAVDQREQSLGLDLRFRQTGTRAQLRQPGLHGGTQCCDVEREAPDDLMLETQGVEQAPQALVPFDRSEALPQQSFDVGERIIRSGGHRAPDALHALVEDGT